MDLASFKAKSYNINSNLWYDKRIRNEEIKASVIYISNGLLVGAELPIYLMFICTYKLNEYTPYLIYIYEWHDTLDNNYYNSPNVVYCRINKNIKNSIYLTKTYYIKNGKHPIIIKTRSYNNKIYLINSDMLTIYFSINGDILKNFYSSSHINRLLILIHKLKDIIHNIPSSIYKLNFTNLEKGYEVYSIK
jgi:hypothetical protein